MPSVPSTYSVQFIFVLVPTVALAAQWNNVIAAQLPSVQVKFLSGADGVDRWRDQWIWDEVLSNVRVVVCTYQVRILLFTHSDIDASDTSRYAYTWLHPHVQSSAYCLRRRYNCNFRYLDGNHVAKKQRITVFNPTPRTE